MPVEKNALPVFDGEVSLGDRKNMAFMSTMITYGRGRGIVTGTGMNTQIGMIAEMLQSFEVESTPLQKKLEDLGKLLGTSCLVICALVFIYGLFRDTHLASAFSDEWYLQLQERGSMGARSIAVRGGVIDSGFRGEWLVGLTNHNSKPVIFADERQRASLASSSEDLIILPIEKAICQAVLLPVPKAVAVEIDADELRNIPSQRGGGMLGSSGK